MRCNEGSHPRLPLHRLPHGEATFIGGGVHQRRWRRNSSTTSFQLLPKQPPHISQRSRICLILHLLWIALQQHSAFRTPQRLAARCCFRNTGGGRTLMKFSAVRTRPLSRTICPWSSTQLQCERLHSSRFLISSRRDGPYPSANTRARCAPAVSRLCCEGDLEESEPLDLIHNTLDLPKPLLRAARSSCRAPVTGLLCRKLLPSLCKATSQTDQKGPSHSNSPGSKHPRCQSETSAGSSHWFDPCSPDRGAPLPRSRSGASNPWPTHEPR